MQAGAFHDNAVLPYQGVAGSAMSDGQRRVLLALAGSYVGWNADRHAEVRLSEVAAHLDETWFSWYGGYDDESPFYYRVHSPVILIEFDHHPGVVFDNEVPTRHHVHTLVRTPNGGDYGTDLLRQHYERFDHTGGRHRAGSGRSVARRRVACVCRWIRPRLLALAYDAASAATFGMRGHPVRRRGRRGGAGLDRVALHVGRAPARRRADGPGRRRRRRVRLRQPAGRCGGDGDDRVQDQLPRLGPGGAAVPGDQHAAPRRIVHHRRRDRAARLLDGRLVAKTTQTQTVLRPR